MLNPGLTVLAFVTVLVGAIALLKLFPEWSQNSRGHALRKFGSLLSSAIIAWIFCGYCIGYNDINSVPDFFSFLGGGGVASGGSGSAGFLLVRILTTSSPLIVSVAIFYMLAGRSLRTWALVVFGIFWSLAVCGPVARFLWGHEIPDRFAARDYAGALLIIGALMAALAARIWQGRAAPKILKHSRSPAGSMGGALFIWTALCLDFSSGMHKVEVNSLTSTILCWAAAMLTTLAFRGLSANTRRADVTLGSFFGLVAITPASGFIPFQAAPIVGFVASLAANLIIGGRDESGWNFSNICWAFAASISIGMVSVAIFARPAANSLLYNALPGRWQLLCNQMLACVIVTGVIFLLCAGIFAGLKYSGGFREDLSYEPL